LNDRRDFADVDYRDSINVRLYRADIVIFRYLRNSAQVRSRNYLRIFLPPEKGSYSESTMSVDA